MSRGPQWIPDGKRIEIGLGGMLELLSSSVTAPAMFWLQVRSRKSGQEVADVKREWGNGSPQVNLMQKRAGQLGDFRRSGIFCRTCGTAEEV